MFNGLDIHMGNLCRLSHADTRSISPENFTGEKGKGGMATQGTGTQCARDLGQGWKISPSVTVSPNTVFELASISGPGAIQQIWLTPTGNWRHSIIRFFWDEEETPSIECPIGDFFCMGWGRYAQMSSLAVCVNPGSAFNCYWQMPFKKHCRITLENLASEEIRLYYQVNYALSPIEDDAAYLHAQWRRSNPLPYKEVHSLVEGVQGWGHFVGTYLAWQVNNGGWWGEGEMKFYLDGDQWPTICGTGTEDYFCGSYNFDSNGRYTSFCTPYSGLHQVLLPDGAYDSQQRFGMYRWHIPDPVRFKNDLRVTIQALGWRDGGRYLPLQDDIASVAFWYQREPHAPFPALPDKDGLEVV